MPKGEDPQTGRLTDPSYDGPLDPDTKEGFTIHFKERKRGFRRRKIDTPLENQPTLIAVQDLHQQLAKMAKGEIPTYEGVAKIANFTGKREEYNQPEGRRTGKKGNYQDRHLSGPGYDQTLLRTHSESTIEDYLWVPNVQHTEERFTVSYRAPITSEGKTTCETVTLLHEEKNTVVIATVGIDPTTQNMLFIVSTLGRDQTWYLNQDLQPDYCYLVQPQQTIDITAYQQSHGETRTLEPLQFFTQHPPSLE